MGYWVSDGLLCYIFQIVFDLYLKIVPVISAVDDDDYYDEDDDDYDDDNDDDDDDNLQRDHFINITVSPSGE